MKRRTLLKTLASLPLVISAGNLLSKITPSKRVLGKVAIASKPRTIEVDSNFPDVQIDLKTGRLYMEVPDEQLRDIEFRPTFREVKKVSTLWMSAKKDGQCAECEAPIITDDRIVWDTTEYKAYCTDCGEEIAGLDPRRRHA